jgi:hypothetical protein
MTDPIYSDQIAQAQPTYSQALRDEMLYKRLSSSKKLIDLAERYSEEVSEAQVEAHYKETLRRLRQLTPDEVFVFGKLDRELSAKSLGTPETSELAKLWNQVQRKMIDLIQVHFGKGKTQYQLTETQQDEFEAILKKDAEFLSILHKAQLQQRIDDQKQPNDSTFRNLDSKFTTQCPTIKNWPNSMPRSPRTGTVYNLNAFGYARNSNSIDDIICDYVVGTVAPPLRFNSYTYRTRDKGRCIYESFPSLAADRNKSVVIIGGIRAFFVCGIVNAKAMTQHLWLKRTR